jgi:Fe-S cluster assembly protein SufD
MMSELTRQITAGLPHMTGDGPGWAAALREAAAGQFSEHGLPTKRDEAWKYTSLRTLEQRGLRLSAGTVADAGGSNFPAPLPGTGCRARMLDGCLLGFDAGPPEGVTVLSLADALAGGVAGLRPLLESIATEAAGSANGFSLLNTALLGAGLVVQVAENTDAGRLALSWMGGPHSDKQLMNSRVCLLLEKGARLELVEQFESPIAANSNIVLQAQLGEGARLQHVRFQHEQESAALITRTLVMQDSGSEYTHFGFDLGGGLVRHDLHATLAGEGATAAIAGAYLLDGSRHVDNHARVDHVAPGCTSEQFFRGVAGGSSRAVFNTAVKVHEGADGTEARQSNANILLSPLAEVDTKPELEIYADEVVASHGATVGQLDEQAVFYLRTRGLSDHDARQMLTTAFCRSVSDRLEDSALADWISERMMAVMPKSAQ